ncbi:glutamine--fructose-6-phosphate transaminase (isomerizing) [candidate division WOR-3 bacterium]|nr:glutamine--fructose-6-phosphate transaminase (isomerizing) [candidate division WOR-3 bacterium]
MCGIVGYIRSGKWEVGSKKSIDTVILKGLERLEYRGYDSAGIATICNNKLKLKKSVGKLTHLKNILKKTPLSGTIGIGHTRWATHGEPSEKNAHPHTDCSKKIAIVHNGIIENYVSLRKLLEKEGHKFKSDTDTEVLAHLIEKFYNGDMVKAVQEALALVEGAYAIVVITQEEPKKMVVARLGSPLVIGICGKGEYIVASDPVAILPHTRHVIYLHDNEMALLSPSGYQTMTTANVGIEKEVERITGSLEKIKKGGYPHFMLKEIYEQPKTIHDTMRGRVLAKKGEIKLGGLDTLVESALGRKKKIAALDKLLQADRLIIIACGTSWHAGLIGEYMIENMSGLIVEVEYASEARYKNFIVNKNTAVLAISQSGETADTLAALKEAKKRGATVLGLVNVVGSTIARETEAGIYLHAGPEIGVASTKAFTSQITTLALISLLLARKKNIISLKKSREIINAIVKLPAQVQEILKNSSQIRKIANKYVNFNNALYLGRGYNFPIALEGALKLKEIAYIHAEGYPAAEMKHGPIALIDEKMPVVALVTDTEDKIYQKVMSNIEEVKSRKGTIIAIATKGNKEIKNVVDHVIYVPKTEDFLTPILTVIPLQLFAYHIAVLRGLDVDKPRNLAKSVTVE